MAVRRAGIDTGGTFTDGVAETPDGPTTVKVLSTPDDPARAVRHALAALGGLAEGGRLHHGSTVGTNAVLTRDGARVALVSTEGFEDVLHLARGDRRDLHALAPSRARPLVPPDRCFGAPERMGADGRVVRAPEDAAVGALVAAVRRCEPEAVALSLLHGVRNPVHERRLAAALRRALAGTGVTVHLGSDLSADPREAERAATAVLDAFVGPGVVAYVRRLARALPAGALTVQRSDGGRMTAAEVRRAPVRTLLSGPAAGVAAAHAVTRRLGIDRALSFDVGGTSTDVAWIAGGELPVREVLAVGEHRASVPSLALETVGAGGGSIVWVDEGGALRVGPRSAGADPGPACYGHGGPFTLTDAWCLLGRLPEALLGGGFPLDPDGARREATPLARRAGLSPRRLAEGAVAVASATTARALRRASAQQGHDPRGAHLVAFGGAGPTLAAETADRLDLRGVVVPQHAGALAAWGTLLAPLRADASRVARRQDSAGLRKGLDELAAKVGARLAKEGATRPTLHSELDVRYVGQAFTVTVPYGAAWRRAFDEGHGRRFGFADPQRAVEVVRLRVRGLGYEGRRRRARRASATNPRWRRATPAFVKDGVGHRAREALPPGATLRGPAVVGEATATTWVPRGWTARIAAEGDLVLERES